MNQRSGVGSVDELRFSSSTRGISMLNFEVLDARIASALNKIIHTSQFKRRISLEEQKAQKEDRFLRGRQIAYLIYDQFRVTGTDDSVENYTDLFTISLRNDDIQEFDSKEFESLRNSRPCWNCTTWRIVRRSQDLIITDWKLWWREVSSRKFEIRILGAEMEFLRRTPWSRIREQNSVYKEFLEIVGNGKPTGSVCKETIVVSATIWTSVEKVHHQIRLRILSCSRMSEYIREPEVPE